MASHFFGCQTIEKAITVGFGLSLRVIENFRCPIALSQQLHFDIFELLMDVFHPDTFVFRVDPTSGKINHRQILGDGKHFVKGFGYIWNLLMSKFESTNQP